MGWLTKFATRGRAAIVWLFAERGGLRGFESSACLALFRVLYCGGVMFEVLRTQQHRDSSYNRPSYDPIDLLAIFGVEPMPLEFFQSVRWLLVGALLFAILGIFTRAALWIAFLSFLAYEGTYLGFTKPIDSQYVYHMSNLTAFVLGILAISPDTGNHGVVSLLRGAPTAIAAPRWPRRAVIGAIAVAYFGAGYCKMVESPLWVDGYTLQGYMLDRAIRHDIDSAIWLASHYWLCVFLSVMTIVLELSWILVIFFPRLAWTHVPGGLLLHVSILLTMKIDFFQFFALNYLVFVDWDWLARRFSALRSLPRDSIASAPNQPVPRFATLFLLFMFGCVIGRVESWPLTDFRVYSKRRHPDRVGVILLKKEMPDGQLVEVNNSVMLKFRRNVGFETAGEISAAMRLPEAERAEELEKLRLAVYRNVTRFDRKFFKRHKTLRLFVERPVWDEYYGRYRIEKQFVMALPPAP